MTDTQPLVPTDAEMEAFAIEEQFLLFCDVDEFTQIARAVLAKWGHAASGAGEPFCYVSVNKQGDITRTMKRKDKWTNIPLYTTLQPTQPQVGAVPLTQAQIVEAFCELPHQVQFVTAFDQGVRFAERHHGITGGRA